MGVAKTPDCATGQTAETDIAGRNERRELALDRAGEREVGEREDRAIRGGSAVIENRPAA